ncbi:type VI secretion system baseplate subunit TssF [Sansalvadorimonas sp. 2012CJ34-2]|uniref:Type VI secretion system baseplate subunit TssF n=1 Tax=Parendozoicomonas callyspongiae TaxID=2942213 RepID=A0ABT0PDF1_9GAMM|nr:type VI secretion system baseplate subunit TssF [Sansalvadorimonas sp. 2012CJ34-2]MCL6269333.1 type VI secretion system baseplate subunit TssF [Sansalvadorimonas sp. 2012CJ34-2]
MSEKLLPLYEKELAFIQQSAGEFAKRHPSVASSLLLDTDTVADPLVAQLLSGFAYLNARIQQKLDDEFPELTEAMLETLYPHYLRPAPSMAVIQFEPEALLDAPACVPAGTLVDTEQASGGSCRFKTAYDVTVPAIKVKSASLQPRPFIAPGSNKVTEANAVLKLAFKTLAEESAVGEVVSPSTRFFLRGQPQHVYPLYDLLLTKAVKLVVATGEDDPQPVYLDADCIRAIGFEEDEGLIPYPDNAFLGYRLLTEYFVFPEKFLFIDIDGLDKALAGNEKQGFHLYIYLEESVDELEHQLSAKMFALGCTPVVNLFPQRAEPISLDHTSYEYPVVPDLRRRDEMETWSVEKVVSSDSSGKKRGFTPFYSYRHHQVEAGQTAFWISHRREVVEGEHMNEQASEVDIRLVDLEFNPFLEGNSVLHLETLCTNRNLPRKLPTGGGQPHFTVVDGDAPTKRISSVISPTAVVRAPMKEGAYWRLISHLNLNFLSLSRGTDSCEAFKEILRLYNFRDSASTRNLIESIRTMQTRTITAPIPIDNTVVLCRGTEVEIELDSMMMTGTSPLLFSSVIERFLGVYCSINSFVRLIVRLSGKDGEFRRWPPRAGEKALL